MDIPQMALKEVLFWAIAVIIGGVIAGAATSFGGMIIKRLWFRNAHERRQDPSLFAELIAMQKGSIQSNQEVVDAIRAHSNSVEHLTETLQRRFTQASEEHALILREVRDIDRGRRVV